MIKLLNTLYVTNDLCYISKERQNIVILMNDTVVKRIPIHIIKGIVCFNYNGMSPQAMKLCVDNNVAVSFITPYGKFQARITGKLNGNVLLRREQYRIADDELKSIKIAKNCIIGKLNNSRKILMRAIRDHSNKVNVSDLETTIYNLKKQIIKIDSETIDKDSLRGIEGESARSYFSHFDDLILDSKSQFQFNERSKRPPRNEVNALLSFLYSLLAHDVQSSLEAVGLDSYVGFFHTDRPGRAGLALDMMEELRPYLVDRLVLTLINQKQVNNNHFVEKENGAFLLNEKGRKLVLNAWQNKKHVEIRHPYIDEKIKIGLISHVQAQLLARYIRGDIDEYPPFLI